MEYFNTCVKTYGKNKSENIRFIRYEDIISRPATDKEAEIVRNRLRELHSDSAECQEVSQEVEERDYKVESIARAKRNIKNIVRNNYSQRLKLLTLTYCNIVTDREKVLNDIKNMCKRFKHIYGQELKYIATLEWQEPRHCLHVHMIIDCQYIEQKIWSDALWLQGYVGINTISHGKSKSDCLNAVDYCLKYIGKDFDSCEYYHHLYYRSRNWRMYVKKEYTVTKDIDECVSLARRYFQANDYDIRTFEYNIYKDVWITIVDVYPFFNP